MTFNTNGNKENPSLLLIPGLGVSYEIFLPLIELLKDKYHIVAVGIDGFLIGQESNFTSVDDQAVQVIRFVQGNLGGHLDVAYGLSLGGKILSRIMERNEIVIDHAIMDAAPLLPLPKWSVNPLRYYQSFNVWTCYHWTGFWKFVFHSHYFDVLLDECKKVWPYGKGKAVRDGYKDVYTNKLESIQGADIHFWYGTKEAFVAKPQAAHLQKLCPNVHVEVFPKMNHGQLLVDHPEEIATRILNIKQTDNINVGRKDMIQKHCYECGTALIEKELEGEGIVPYCPKCEQFRFPMYNVAVSMIVINEQTGEILLIKQYGRPHFVLVAGYVNRGEQVEHAVGREIKEETGMTVSRIKFNRTSFFEPSNTLMCNFTAFVKDDSELSPNREIDSYQWFSPDDARKNIRPNSLAESFLNAYLDE